MSDSFLPPVIVDVTGTITGLINAIGDAKVLLADFAKKSYAVRLTGHYKELSSQIKAAEGQARTYASKTYDTHLSADAKEMIAKVNAAEAEGKKFQTKTYSPILDANTKTFQTKLYAINKELEKWGRTREYATADVSTAAAVTKLLAINKALNAWGKSKDVSAAGEVAGASIAAGMATSLRKAITVSNLGIGKGSFTGVFSSIAKIFSAGFLTPAELAGFGPEHLGFVLGGLMASGVEAGLGAALKGTAALTVNIVGTLTDAAGIGQAAGDIKNVAAAMSALAQATKEYGKYSPEAKQATLNLQQALTSFNPVARGAVTRAAELYNNFKALFDLNTGQAEKKGANIISAFIVSLQPFLGPIGTSASKNMTIIMNALKPFFAWLDSQKPGGGLAIFKELEAIFTAHLPTGMKAFTQGIELFVKTMGQLAPSTGGITKDLANFFEKYNSKQGFQKWMADVDHLISKTKQWETFLKALIKTVSELFGDDKSDTSGGILNTLTQMLNKADSYLESTSGKKALASVFSAHKNEIIAMLKLIPSLVSAISGVYLVLAPILTKAATDAIKIVTWLSKLDGGNFAKAFAWVYVLSKAVKALTGISALSKLGGFVLKIAGVGGGGTTLTGAAGKLTLAGEALQRAALKLGGAAEVEETDATAGTGSGLASSVKSIAAIAIPIVVAYFAYKGLQSLDAGKHTRSSITSETNKKDTAAQLAALLKQYLASIQDPHISQFAQAEIWARAAQKKGVSNVLLAQALSKEGFSAQEIANALNIAKALVVADITKIKPGSGAGVSAIPPPKKKHDGTVAGDIYMTAFTTALGSQTHITASLAAYKKQKTVTDAFMHNTSIPDLKNQGAAMMNALAQGIQSSTPTVEAALTTMLNKLLVTASKGMTTAGGNLGTALVQALRAGSSS